METGTASLRHYSTGTIVKPHKFEIHYESTYLPNRPVHARLHQYDYDKYTFDDTLSSAACDLMPLSGLEEVEELDAHECDGSGVDPLERPSILRSSSMPLLKHNRTLSLDSARDQKATSASVESPLEKGVQLRKDDTPNYTMNSSRKNSLVSNCTHSRESSVCLDEASCWRHHHRRGSVAIKFEEKKVLQ